MKETLEQLNVRLMSESSVKKYRRVQESVKIKKENRTALGDLR